MMATFSLDAVEFFFQSNVQILVPGAGLPSIARLPAFRGRHIHLLLDAYQGPGLRVPLSFPDNRRVVGRRSRGCREISARAQNDLINLDTVFSHLNAQRVGAAGRECHRCRL